MKAALTGLAALALVCAIALAWPSKAGPVVYCGNGKAMAVGLKERYQEGQIGTGLASSGNLIRLLVSPSGDTWTMLSERPDGHACVMAIGTAWAAEVRREGSL